MTELVEDPALISRAVGLAAIVKSGRGGGGGVATTLTVMLAEWDNEPLVPVTVRVAQQAGVL